MKILLNIINVSIGDTVEIGIDWMTAHFAPFFDGVKAIILAVINGFAFLFNFIPFYIVIALLIVIAWKLAENQPHCLPHWDFYLFAIWACGAILWILLPS